MNKKTARSLFMDYLYEEMEADQKQKFENFISQHSDLQKELEELSDVRAMIAHLPVQDPAEVEPKSRGFKEWWGEFVAALIPKNGFARAGYALGFCLLLLMIIGAFFKMNIIFNDKGFMLAFGDPVLQEEHVEEAEQTFSVEQVEYLIAQVKEENALLMAQFIEAAQEQQDQKIEQAFTSFAHYMDQQRTSDLQLISSDLSSLEESYYDRFRQTDRVIGEIIQTVNRN